MAGCGPMAGQAITSEAALQPPSCRLPEHVVGGGPTGPTPQAGHCNTDQLISLVHRGGLRRFEGPCMY